MRPLILLLVSAAGVVLTGAISARAQTQVYSFETLYDTTDTPNPAGTRPDDFYANGGGTTITQSTIGATDGAHSLAFTMVGGATFSGAQTSNLPPITNIIDQPPAEALNFDLTVPANGQFTGAFADMGLMEFGLDNSNPLYPNSPGQVQTDLQAQVNVALPPGTYNLTIPLLGMNNPITFAENVPFYTCFGPDTSSQLTATSFEFLINKSSDSPLTVYIDNVRAVPLMGDTNDDFSVDSTDMATVMANYGKSVTGGYADGDFNLDGIVNGDDWALYTLGAAQFQELPAFESAPEPSVVGMLAALALAATTRRRAGR